MIGLKFVSSKGLGATLALSGRFDYRRSCVSQTLHAPL
jgi:hypothetical protein